MAISSCFHQSELNVDDRAGRQRWRGSGLLTLAESDHNGHASRPCREHVAYRHKLQHKGRQQQRMETDEPPSQDHRQDVQQFIRKCPSEWTHEQLESVRCQGDTVGERDAPSCEKGRLEYLREYHGHFKTVYRLQRGAAVCTCSGRKPMPTNLAGKRRKSGQRLKSFKGHGTGICSLVPRTRRITRS